MSFPDQDAQRTTVCHKTNHPAKQMYAFRLADLADDPWETQLTLTCLQGLVNRDEPRLFLVQDKYDDLWLKWLQERKDIETVHWLCVDKRHSKQGE